MLSGCVMHVGDFDRAPDTSADLTALAGSLILGSTPEIKAQTVTGKTFRLSDLRGRVVVLNFWATWCIPCREEIPELIAMQHDLDSRGLSIVGAVWNDTATIDEIKEYQKEQKLDYTILLDGDSIADKLGGIRSVPTTFIIDRQGRIRKEFMRQVNRATLEAAIETLLVEAPAMTKN
jgi:thiol-disulfide isomerase/thioredoxin